MYRLIKPKATPEAAVRRVATLLGSEAKTAVAENRRRADLLFGEMLHCREFDQRTHRGKLYPRKSLWHDVYGGFVTFTSENLETVKNIFTKGVCNGCADCETRQTLSLVFSSYWHSCTL